jgi:rhodanese-related sulfurtransferase
MLLTALAVVVGASVILADPDLPRPRHRPDGRRDRLAAHQPHGRAGALLHGKVASLDKKKPVLVYCAGGFRSRKAVVKLKELGFENIQHIHRGYMSWRPDAER